MAKASFHRRLQHVCRSDFWLEFGEKRRVFVVDEKDSDGKSEMGSERIKRDYKISDKIALSRLLDEIKGAHWVLQRVQSEIGKGITADSLREGELQALLKNDEILEQLNPTEIESLKKFVEEMKVARTRQQLELGGAGIRQLFDQKYFERFKQRIDQEMGFELEGVVEQKPESFQNDFRERLRSVFEEDKRAKTKEDAEKQKKERREKREKERRIRAKLSKLDIEADVRKEVEESIAKILENGVGNPEEFIESIEKDAKKRTVEEQKARIKEYNRRLKFEKRLAAREKELVIQTRLKLERLVMGAAIEMIDVEMAEDKVAEKWAVEKAKLIEEEKGKREQYAKQELLRWRHRKSQLDRGGRMTVQDRYMHDMEKDFEELAKEDAEKELLVRMLPANHLNGLNSLKRALKNIQDNKIESVKNYLEDKQKALKDKFKPYSDLFQKGDPTQEGLFSHTLEGRLDTVKNSLNLFHTNTFENNLLAIKRIEEELIQLETDINMGIEELESVDREDLKGRIKTNYTTFKDFYSDPAIPGHIQSLIQKIDSGQIRVEKIDQEKRITARWLEGVAKSFEPDNLQGLLQLHKENLGFDPSTGEVNFSQLDGMSSEELVRLSRDLKDAVPDINFGSWDQGIERDENDSIAHAARMCISEMEKERDPKEMERILKERLGEDHVVVTNEFSKYNVADPGQPEERVDLGKFTTQKGGMVFYQRQNNRGEKEWKIIIDAKRFSDPKQVEEAYKSLRHELLHVEFEHSPQEKQENFIQGLTQSNYWSEIKEQFLALSKTPPGDEGWTDYNIAHELYAMQYDLANFHVPEEKINAETDPKEKARFRLNNALVRAALYQKLGLKAGQALNAAAPEWTHSFRGMEVGVDADAEKDASSEDSSDSAGGGKKVHGNYDMNKKEIEKFNDDLAELEQDPLNTHFPEVVDRLKELKKENIKTNDYNEDLKARPTRGNAEQIKRRNKMMEDSIKEVKSFFGGVNKRMMELDPNNGRGAFGFFQSFWVNTLFISPTGFSKAITTAIQAIKKWSDLNTDAQGHTLIKASAGDTRLGRKAVSDLAGNENQRVSDWQDNMKEFSAEQLVQNLAKLASSPNKFELKATIRLLADNGRLDWNDPNLQQTLNRLQNAVYFKPGDKRLVEDKTMLNFMAKKAISTIYDANEFPSLQQKNQSSYEGKKNTAMGEAKEEGAVLTPMLYRMLKEKKDGIDVDPAKFEGTLQYCIEAGRSEPEHILFAIFAGVALGILRPERMIVFTEKSNTLPHLDYFLTYRPLTQLSMQKICKENFPIAFENCSLGDVGEPGMMEFKKFMLNTMETQEDVRYRLRNAIGTVAKFDKDHMRAIVRMGNANSIDQLTAGQSGRVSLEANRVDNMVVGTLEAMEGYCKSFSKDDLSESDIEKIFSELVANFAMQHGVFSGIYDANDKTRARYSHKNARSQMSYMTFHPNWTVQENVTQMKKIVDVIDPIFFSMIFDEGFKSNPSDTVKLKRIQMYLYNTGITTSEQQFNSIDQVYKALDNLMPNIINRARSSGRLSQLKKFAPPLSSSAKAA